MIELIEAVLALVGFFAVVGVTGLLIAMRSGVQPAAPPDPYRDGLDTAARITAMAWEAEQALYRAAWKAHNE